MNKEELKPIKIDTELYKIGWAKVHGRQNGRFGYDHLMRRNRFLIPKSYKNPLRYTPEQLPSLPCLRLIRLLAEFEGLEKTLEAYLKKYPATEQIEIYVEYAFAYEISANMVRSALTILKDPSQKPVVLQTFLFSQDEATRKAAKKAIEEGN